MSDQSAIEEERRRRESLPEQTPEEGARYRAEEIAKLEAGRMARSWHLDPPLHYAENEHILSWWKPEYDAMLEELIEEHGWGWHQAGSRALIARLPAHEIEAWRAVDPLCEQYAYYNILLNFAVARAKKLGFEKKLKPQVRPCAVCGEEFSDESLKAGWKRFGDEVCAACLAPALWLRGDPLADRGSVLNLIRELVEVLERIPPQTMVIDDVINLPAEKRFAAIRILRDRPDPARVRELFGSWLHALIEAGVLEEDAQRMARGTRCLAKDGHVCHSIGEKTIDDLLSTEGIPHEREPPYPESRMRADFKVGETLVEYFGLAGQVEYDEKTARKRELCERHGVNLIAVYPSDLADLDALRKRLLAADPAP